MLFRKLVAFFVIAISGVIGAARANEFEFDTSDPLYMMDRKDILSESTVTYYDSVLRIGQGLGYGITERLSASANIHYQNDFAGDEDGFSSFDLGGRYRLARAGDNEYRIITDVLLGLKVGGSSHVRTPWFADSTYYAGLRFGRQWAGMTLSGTIKSSWIFDDERGMSYIDFVPEAYFRIAPDWRAGIDFDWRKATNPDYDQEWLNLKLIRQYGRTQYIGTVGFEFEEGELEAGFKLNVLF